MKQQFAQYGQHGEAVVSSGVTAALVTAGASPSLAGVAGVAAGAIYGYRQSVESDRASAQATSSQRGVSAAQAGMSSRAGVEIGGSLNAANGQEAAAVLRAAGQVPGGVRIAGSVNIGSAPSQTAQQLQGGRPVSSAESGQPGQQVQPGQSAQSGSRLPARQQEFLRANQTGQPARTASASGATPNRAVAPRRSIRNSQGR